MMHLLNPILSKLYFIILTETWFNEVNADIYTLPGFNGVHNFRTRKKGGRVSIFVRNTISYSCIRKLNVMHNDYELLFIT